MSTSPAVERTSEGPGSRRAGYVVAIAVNAVMLWVVHRLLDWGWPRFLTADFEELVPIISFSLVASILVNAVYVIWDRGAVRPAGDLLTAVIGVVVTVRTYQVFPFDFSTYSRDWTTLARIVVILGIVGTSIAVLVNGIRLLRALGERTAQM
ncbi:MAG: hypothetical protein R2716_00395 [Microthrixaceae bacterium]